MTSKLSKIFVLSASFCFLGAVNALSQADDSAGKAVLQLSPSIFAISESDCRYVSRHQPDADVAYQPGVDVHGKPVAPADLTSGQLMEIPEIISYELLTQLDTQKEVGDADLKPEGSIGTVSVDTVTGHLAVNGKPLLDREKRAIEVFCNAQTSSN